MGGSVLVRACPLLLEKKYKVTGVAVLDVVEGSYSSSPSALRNLKCETGSAIEALPHMNRLLDSRPDGFESTEDAIEWQ